MEKKELNKKYYIVNNEKVFSGKYISSSERWSYYQLEDGSVTGFADNIVFEDPEKALKKLVEIYEEKIKKIQSLKLLELEKLVEKTESSKLKQ